MELIRGSETSANYILTPGEIPKRTYTKLITPYIPCYKFFLVPEVKEFLPPTYKLQINTTDNSTYRVIQEESALLWEMTV
jgi:hypothetical protein